VCHLPQGERAPCPLRLHVVPTNVPSYKTLRRLRSSNVGVARVVIMSIRETAARSASYGRCGTKQRATQWLQTAMLGSSPKFARVSARRIGWGHSKKSPASFYAHMPTYTRGLDRGAESAIMPGIERKRAHLEPLPETRALLTQPKWSENCRLRRSRLSRCGEQMLDWRGAGDRMHVASFHGNKSIEHAQVAAALPARQQKRYYSPTWVDEGRRLPVVDCTVGY